MKVLNIPVSPQLLARWAEWLAPPVQPFFLTEAETLALGLPSCPSADGLPTPELSDTFTVWNLSAAANRTALLSEAEWNALSASARQTLVRLQVRYGRGNVPHARAFADLRPELRP
ncbi:MAG: hypothetical protein JWQ08_2275, partial [Deinococcus sp.]|nr:hypothetical protein [Deinococcus sp.]